MELPYQAVSVATMLRDFAEVDYINGEHKMLCDLADTIYHTGMTPERNPEMFRPEYKELYNRYGKEFFDTAYQDMRAIDSQLDPYNRYDLEDDYKYIKQQLTEEK